MGTPVTDPRDAALARHLSTAHELEPGCGIWADELDESVYHSLAGPWSRSQLEDLIGLDASPALFHAKHIARSVPFEETKSLRRGRWLHCAVLEPERWERSYIRELPRVPKPEKPDLSEHGAPSSKAYRQALAAWREAADAEYAAALDERARELAGRTELGDEDHDVVLAMAGAIAEHPDASRLLSGEGFRERACFWRDAETGMLMRGRLDLALAGDVVVDVKTTAHPDPDGFGRSCAQYGYHRQAACYLDAALAVTGRAHVFRLVVVHNEAPYEVAVYGFDDVALEAGRQQYRRALDELAWRLRDADWLADWQKQPHELHLPGWALAI